MKSLKLLIATAVAIALSAATTANAARDRTSATSNTSAKTNASKNQIQSRSQWRELNRDQSDRAAKDVDDTTSHDSQWKMGRDQNDDTSSYWRGRAARDDRMRDQDDRMTGADRRDSGRSGQGLRELEQLGSARIMFYRLGPADMRMSKLIGLDVKNLQNENVGEIDDVILDNNKTLRAVIISVGGFLGIGERHVAVDPSSLVIARNEDGDVEAILNTTREDLREAPQFRSDERRRRVGQAQ